MLREFPDSMIANTLHDLDFDVTMVEKSRWPEGQRGESIRGYVVITESGTLPPVIIIRNRTVGPKGQGFQGVSTDTNPMILAVAT